MTTRISLAIALSLFLLAAAPLRDAGGRIHRSRAAVHRFEILTHHPHGWPGHGVDHIVPLADGGPDDPVNMQWQAVAAAKAKDRVEHNAGALISERAMLRDRQRAALRVIGVNP